LNLCQVSFIQFFNQDDYFVPGLNEKITDLFCWPHVIVYVCVIRFSRLVLSSKK